jgi:hypothetical protein
MDIQKPGAFCVGGEIYFDDVNGIPTTNWSISLTIESLDDEGFYIVDDYAEIPPVLLLSNDSSRVFAPSKPADNGQGDTLHTYYNRTYSGTASDWPYSYYDWAVQRFLSWMPENTDTSVQHYRITIDCACDDITTHEPHLGSNLNCWVQSYEDDYTYSWWFGMSGTWFGPGHDYWWQSGNWFGVNHQNTYSYEGDTHTFWDEDETGPIDLVNSNCMLLEQN